MEDEKKEEKTRDYISAGNLGGSFLDRYYKMQGIEGTNIYDARTLRIFAAGKHFHELVQNTFEKIGILMGKEEYVEVPEDEEHLKVLGYYDMKLGGMANWNESRQKINDSSFSEFIKKVSLQMVDNLEKKYPEGLEPCIGEIKTINSNAFWNKKNFIGDGYEHHKLQLYTYLKGTGLKTGRLLYISKDDLSLQEIIIKVPNLILEEKWQKDVKTMTKYYREKKVPPKESDLVFERGKYSANWKLARSPYLELITGMKKEKWIARTMMQVKQQNQLLKDQKQLKKKSVGKIITN